MLPFARRARVWPGAPYPLGATFDGRGVNFALFSANAEKVELCLFDDARPSASSSGSCCPSTPTRSGTATCRTSAPASSTATASTGPTTPSAATASTPTSCCSTPTPSSSGASSAGRTRTSATASAAGARTSAVRRARQRPRHAEVPGGRHRLHLGRRPAACARPGTRASSTRPTCAASPCCTRTCRGACAAPAPASRSPEVIDHIQQPGRHRGRVPAGARLRPGPPPDRAGPAPTTGATTRSASSRRSRATSPRATSAEWKTMVALPARRRHRGDPRRRLQPHRRGQPPGPDAVVQGHRQRLLLQAVARRPALLLGLHRLRQHAEPAATRACCRWSWTRCATGSRRCTSTASASTSTSALARDPYDFDYGSGFLDASARTRCCPRSS